MIEHIIHIGLKHKLLAFMTTVGVCALGVFSLSRLSIDAFPDISPNLVQVFAEVDGMAAEEVEQLVTRSAETAMRSIPGVKKIRSLSSLGLSTVNIYFEDGVNIGDARRMVSERLKLAEEGLPKGVDMPHGLEMGPMASGMGKILAYYLQAENMDITELRTLHEWTVKRGIETVPGVVKVQTTLAEDFAVVTPQSGKQISPRALWEAIEKAKFTPVKLQGPAGIYTAKPAR